MTEISIIILALGLIIEGFNHCKLVFRVKELEETVESNWSAIGHECFAIWDNIKVILGEDEEEEEIEAEEELEEEEEDEANGDAEFAEM